MTTFVITGVAGAGKTAFIDAMAHNCAAVDLDIVGVHYRGSWINPSELVKLAYYQGFRNFGGVWDREVFSTLLQCDPDMQILFLEPNRQALIDRNRRRKAEGKPERWMFDPKKNDAMRGAVHAWARDNKVGLFDVSRGVPRIMHDQKAGSAADDQLKRWRVAFPMPFKIGWSQLGTDPELDALLDVWLTRLHKFFPLMKKFLARFRDDFSASRWHHFFSVYAPQWGNETIELIKLAASKGFKDDVSDRVGNLLSGSGSGK